MKKTIEVEHINNRFKELMLRDPLVIEYRDRARRHEDSNPELKVGSHIVELPKELKELGMKVLKKWKYALLEGVTSPDKYFGVQKIRQPVSELTPSKQEVIFLESPKHPRQESVFFAESQHVYIDINCSVLDKADEGYIKDAVWAIVKSHIEREKPNDTKKKERTMCKPSDDPPELAFVYHIRENTFRKYLRWYDIHMKDKLSFRLMAHMENIRKVNPQGAEEFLMLITSKKLKWGKTVKGEDNIENGIKLIYAAIHRKPYGGKDICPLIEEYNCPHHGKNCPPGCEYHNQWVDRFNRLNPI